MGGGVPFFFCFSVSCAFVPGFPTDLPRTRTSLWSAQMIRTCVRRFQEDIFRPLGFSRHGLQKTTVSMASSLDAARSSGGCCAEASVGFFSTCILSFTFWVSSWPSVCVYSEDVSQSPSKCSKLSRLKIGGISKSLSNKRQRKRMQSG